MIKVIWRVLCEMITVVIDQRLSGDIRNNIPRRLESITPEWLNSVLSDFPQVKSISIGPRTDGTTSRGVLELECEGEQRSVFVKLASQEFAGRVFSNLEELGTREARFYQNLSQELPIKAPDLYYTDAHEPTGRFVIILEDLRKEGREFRTLDQGCTLEEAELIITEFSKFHAKFWNDKRFGTPAMKWLPTYAHSPNQNITWMLYRKSIDICIKKYPDLMQGEALEIANIVAEKFPQVYAKFAEGDQTVIHGDGYVANMYFDDQGKDVGFLDFQMVTEGHGVREVTYLTASCLPPEVTEANIGRLIKMYCGLLKEQGIEHDFETAWYEHQLAALYFLVGCIVNGAMGHMQTEENNRLAVERAVKMAVSSGSIECVNKI